MPREEHPTFCKVFCLDPLNSALTVIVHLIKNNKHKLFHLKNPVTMKKGKNPKDFLANIINFEPSATWILIKLRSTQAFSIDKPFHKNKSIIGLVFK